VPVEGFVEKNGSKIFSCSSAGIPTPLSCTESTMLAVCSVARIESLLQMQNIAYARKADPRWARLTSGIDFRAPDAEEVSLREAILKSEGLPRKVVKAEIAALRGARATVRP
jgi:hypothetical protein